MHCAAVLADELGLGFGHELQVAFGEIVGGDILAAVRDAQHNQSVVDETKIDASTSIVKCAQSGFDPIAGDPRVSGGSQVANLLFDIGREALGWNRTSDIKVGVDLDEILDGLG